MEIDKRFYDKMAGLCLDHFKTLPKKGKPKHTEWTVLSCIVEEKNNCLEVVALGTGSKCIGKSKMSSLGDILNDSHAEVICRRSFLRYLYNEMKKPNSALLHFNEDMKKYHIKEGVRFHFFSTHVPCGDAAIFPKQDVEDFGCLIEKQSRSTDSEDCDYEVPAKKMKIKDGDIFRTGAKCLSMDEKQDLKLKGYGYHVLGAVRTKPGRGDPTSSVSCSDKLAKWCHLGIQGAILSLLLEKPIYLSSFTVTANTPFCKEALERAIFGRLSNVKLNHPYVQNRIYIGQSDHQFEFSKDSTKQPCPTSISWCKIESNSVEVAVEGKRQGVTKKNINTAAGRLSICKCCFFRCFIDVYETQNMDFLKIPVKDVAYKDVKILAFEYQQSWNSLKASFKVWATKNPDLLNFYS